jgi:predicted Zn-dependent peptidase
VATEVTAPALVETLYELGRIATRPVEAAELEQARQYALGTLQLGMSTQSGLAGLVSTYAGYGLRLDFLAEHSARLAEATIDDVAMAAEKYLGPAKGVVVVLGDAKKVHDSLAAILPVTVEPATRG